MDEELKYLLAVEEAGDLNPIQQSRLAELKANPQYADDLIGSVTEQYAKIAEEYTKRYKEFSEKNPFNFDEILAKETATVKQRLDPYYKQTLSDYLTGVSTKKSRGLEDQRLLLDNLQKDTDSYLGKDKIALADTLERTRQGYADAGTYFSGARLRAEGRAIGDEQTSKGDYLRGQEERKQNITSTAQRGFEDLELDQSNTKREIGSFDANGNFVPGATPTYQVQSQALSAAQQNQSLYNYQKQQYLGAPPGVDANIFAQENNNLLKGTLA